MVKRFVAETQGTAKVVWNVIDTKKSIYVRHGMTGKTAKQEARTLAKELNKFNIMQLRNDLADFLYNVIHT